MQIKKITNREWIQNFWAWTVCWLHGLFDIKPVYFLLRYLKIQFRIYCFRKLLVLIYIKKTFKSRQ